MLYCHEIGLDCWQNIVWLYCHEIWLILSFLGPVCSCWICLNLVWDVSYMQILIKIGEFQYGEDVQWLHFQWPVSSLSNEATFRLIQSLSESVVSNGFIQIFYEPY